MGVTEVARELWHARKSATVLEPPSRRDPLFSLEDGYAVGRLLHEELLASGFEPIGLKLGFTNQAVWSQLGLDRPFFAPIYNETVTDSTQVSLRGLVAPRIEPEIVLGFNSDLQPGAQTAEVTAAIGWVATGFEIVQCHYPEWEMTPADAVADGGVHGLLVVGERVGPVTLDRQMLAEVDVALCRENVVVARGRGSNALGGPVDAVSWLLRLPEAEGLRAGAMVTTGTLTTAFPVATGETWQLDTSGPVTFSRLLVTFS